MNIKRLISLMESRLDDKLNFRRNLGLGITQSHVTNPGINQSGTRTRKFKRQNMPYVVLDLIAYSENTTEGHL